MKVKLLDELVAAGLPSEDYAVTHSAWLALMDVRENGDLDVLLSSRARARMFPDGDPGRTAGLPGPYERRIRFHPANSPYGGFYGASGVDDVIAHHSIEIDSVRFVEPRFYFMYKRHRLEMLRGRASDRSGFQRMLGPLSRSNRVLHRKIRRDVDELAVISQFLVANQHRSGNLADIPDTAWDLPNRNWMPPETPRT